LVSNQIDRQLKIVFFHVGTDCIAINQVSRQALDPEYLSTP
jgi:hypothetical protein